MDAGSLVASLCYGECSHRVDLAKLVAVVALFVTACGKQSSGSASASALALNCSRCGCRIELVVGDIEERTLKVTTICVDRHLWLRKLGPDRTTNVHHE